MNNGQNKGCLDSIFIHFICKILSKSDKHVIKILMLKIIASDLEIRTINIECGHPGHQSNVDIVDAWTYILSAMHLCGILSLSSINACRS